MNLRRLTTNLITDAAYASGMLCASPILLAAMVRNGKLKTDWPGRFGFGGNSPAKDKTRILLHAVSVGEVNAIRPLVKELLARDIDVVISTTTNTGFARAIKIYDSGQCVRFPFDFSASVNQLLKRVDPDLAVMVELELWPNFQRACQKQGIPICVVNGRLSERSFKGYERFKPFISFMFRELTWAGVQDEDYAQRFIDMGVHPDRVSITQSLKWEAAPKTHANGFSDKAQSLQKQLGLKPDHPLLVIGSSGPNEEAVLIKQLNTANLKSQGGKPLQVLIAPRKPERFEEVRKIVREADPAAIVRSELQGVNHNSDSSLFLLDTLGELEAAYELADFVFLGRSLPASGLYGSDPIQPIALGKPTMIGSRHSDFHQIVQAFLQNEVPGIVVTDEPATQIEHWLTNESDATKTAKAGMEVIGKRQGAVQITANQLESLLEANQTQ